MSKKRKQITSPHDKVFRASLKYKEVARECFERYLPQAVLAAVNLEVLEACPEIYVNEYLTLSESDVIYKTEIKGEAGYLCLAAEHQSTDDAFMPYRMLKYNVAIWDFHRSQHPKAKQLPLIINLVFYSGKERYRSSTDFRDLLAAPRELVELFWSKPFILIETQAQKDEDLLNQKWAGLFQYFMKHIYESDLLPYLEKAIPLIKAVDEEDKVGYLEAIINYALVAGEISDAKEFIERVRSEVTEETGEKIMTGAEQLRQEGIRQGIQQGVQQGIQQGERQGECKLFLKLLKRKFSEASLSDYQICLDEADEDQLMLWSERLIDAKSLEEVFAKH